MALAPTGHPKEELGNHHLLPTSGVRLRPAITSEHPSHLLSLPMVSSVQWVPSPKSLPCLWFSTLTFLCHWHECISMCGYNIPCLKVFAYRTKSQCLIEVRRSSAIHLPTCWSHTVCTTPGQQHTGPAVKGSPCRVLLWPGLLYAASYPDARGRESVS